MRYVPRALQNPKYKNEYKCITNKKDYSLYSHQKDGHHTQPHICGLKFYYLYF